MAIASSAPEFRFFESDDDVSRRPNERVRTFKVRSFAISETPSKVRIGPVRKRLEFRKRVKDTHTHKPQNGRDSRDGSLMRSRAGRGSLFENTHVEKTESNNTGIFTARARERERERERELPPRC